MNDKCPQCGAYSGHAPECPTHTVDSLRAALLGSCKIHAHERDILRDMVFRHRESVTFWQGKFHMVRQENNKLRNKARLHALQKPAVDLMAHDLKELRDALGCDGSDLEQLLAAIYKLKDKA